MIAILTGLITGFIMCIPIGPLNLWVMQTVIRKGTLPAILVALGGSLMDVFYFYAILNGLSIISIPESWNTPLKISGILLIVALGIKELFFSSDAKEIPADEKKITYKGVSGYLVLGVVIYTSNPALIITMTGLGTFIKSLELFSFDWMNIILLSISLGLGSFLWFSFLCFMVKKYQETIRNKYLKRFSVISGALMILLGIIMGLRI